MSPATPEKKMFYLPHSTWWMRMFWPGYTWRFPSTVKKIYLSFDDGPDPYATPFVLDELKKYNAKATFFCIGENVAKHPALYKRILDEGHATGNHTQRHLNGWKTNDREYLADVKEAAQYINSNLFRPPYGRIRRSQAKKLAAAMGCEKINLVMWSVLSADFDTTKNGEQCFEYVRRFSRAGSIVVFHDSQKAFPNLSVALPKSLEYFSKQGFEFAHV